MRDAWAQEEWDRGYRGGSKVESAGEGAAEVVVRFVASQAYVDGYNQGREDRARS